MHMQSFSTKEFNVFPALQVGSEFSNQMGCDRDVVNELKGHRN